MTIDKGRNDIDWSTRDRRRIRLPRDAYALAGSVWHVTLTTRPVNPPPFADGAFRDQIVETIGNRCEARGCTVHLLCVMPDHVHLLLEVRNVDVVAVIGDVKSCIAREWWTAGGQGSPWQRRFYDRGVRTPQQFEEVVRYILLNPVEAGLCETWEDYPYFAGAILVGDSP